MRQGRIPKIKGPKMPSMRGLGPSRPGKLVRANACPAWRGRARLWCDIFFPDHNWSGNIHLSFEGGGNALQGDVWCKKKSIAYMDSTVDVVDGGKGEGLCGEVGPRDDSRPCEKKKCPRGKVLWWCAMGASTRNSWSNYGFRIVAKIGAAEIWKNNAVLENTKTKHNP